MGKNYYNLFFNPQFSLLSFFPGPRSPVSGLFFTQSSSLNLDEGWLR
jgi:hypothetical protein